ncbi:pre-mRNA-processing factor 17 [Caerostris darwini]|uniref:Pre-mRNA-processing factor 17 n=2 Tax=Caerostris darwini TaxID=1538125 RepID=A0AAV4UE38_9ARAC|nr:pre-mRNA-processing factor 17 [Caerostris darwini]
MAGISLLKEYNSDSNASDDDTEIFDSSKNIAELKNKFRIDAAPVVEYKDPSANRPCVDPLSRTVNFNPKYEELYAPVAGPENPFKTQQQKADKNMLAGFVESAHINEFHFECQRRTFTSYGYAVDPTLSSTEIVKDKLVSVDSTNESIASVDNKVTVFDKIKEREGDKRKRQKKF